MDKHAGNLGKDQLISALMEGAMCGRPIGAAEKMHPTPRSAKRRAAQDCMGVGLRACKRKIEEEMLTIHPQ